MVFFFFKMDIIWGWGRHFADGADMHRNRLDAFHADNRDQRGKQRSDEECLIVS